MSVTDKTIDVWKHSGILPEISTSLTWIQPPLSKEVGTRSLILSNWFSNWTLVCKWLFPPLNLHPQWNQLLPHRCQLTVEKVVDMRISVCWDQWVSFAEHLNTTANCRSSWFARSQSDHGRTVETVAFQMWTSRVQRFSPLTIFLTRYSFEDHKVVCINWSWSNG